MYINNARGIGEWEATYGSLGMMPTSQLTELPLDILDPWQDWAGNPQPFDYYTQDAMEELAENIRRDGIIEPICVRPKEDGRFEIVAGHNRVTAARLAGLNKIPAQIRNLDDKTAADLLVDSNLKHRKEIKPSERGRAYKLKLDAKNHQGKASDQNGQKLSSRDQVAADVGDSPTNVYRYIRLTYLIPELQTLVDTKKLKLNVAIELSFLRREEQELLQDFPLPSRAVAVELRTASATRPLTAERIAAILEAETKKETPQAIRTDSIRQFFSADATAEEMETEIIAALQFYRANTKV